MSVPLEHSGNDAVDKADARLQVLSLMSLPVYLLNVENVAIVWANDAAVRFWGASSQEELFERDLKSNISATVKLRLRQIKTECFKNARGLKELWTLYPNAVPTSIELQMLAFTDVNGLDLLLVHALSQETKVDAETAYRTTALMHTSTMISAYTKDLELVYCNAAARESIPHSLTHASDRLLDQSDLQHMVQTLETTDECNLEARISTKQGFRWHTVHVERCVNPTTGRTMFLVTESDITEQRRAQEEAHHLAFTDALTGLPNRAALFKKLDEILENNSPAEFALLFLDLDRFKIINDSLGHAVGDQLLIDVAVRLNKAIGSQGMVSRMGGDEFVMVVTHSVDHHELKGIAERILSAMACPVEVAGHKLRVLPSIGISTYPHDADHISLLLENSDAAMYIAKANQCGFYFYDKKMSSSITRTVKDRMGLETDMIGALENDEFELYFQPKVCCRTLSVRGVEALIRWNHPTRGMVPPDKFIDIAEETGQIIDLGNWVMHAAMKQQRKWHDQGVPIPVSLNISARQFSSSDLLSQVSSALTQTGCEPSMIELEITESMLIGDPDAVYTTLHQISAMGVRLALDDFGTGYSNLAYLQRYPLDCLKVDKVFLADHKRSMLMGTILKMGRVIGLEVVVEGVETHTQADWLIAHGCDLMQGYYFSKPLPVKQVTEYMLNNGAPGT